MNGDISTAVTATRKKLPDELYCIINRFAIPIYMLTARYLQFFRARPSLVSKHAYNINAYTNNHTPGTLLLPTFTL